jgi:DNA-binding NarL/FixJ family response regulator
MTRIFIVDDHPVMRRGYANILREEMDLEVCGEAGEGLEALEKIRTLNPDLLISDLTLGSGMGGLELIKTLQTEQPDLPILVVSMHDESLYADRALKAGAKGYVMKAEADTTIVKAVRRVLRGGIYVSEEVSEKILMHFAGGRLEDGQSPLEGLSDRELEVFEHLGHGRTTQEMAEAMLISPKTVESYRARIKEKLGLEHNVELIRRAVQWVDTGA